MVCPKVCKFPEGRHVVFLKFVEMKIESAELTGQTVPMTSQKEIEKTLALSNLPGTTALTSTMPKAKAKPMAMPQEQTNVWDYEEDPELFSR